MSDENNKKDNRPNRSNIPSDQNRSEPGQNNQSGRRHHRHRRPNQENRDQRGPDNRNKTASAGQNSPSVTNTDQRPNPNRKTSRNRNNRHKSPNRNSPQNDNRRQPQHNHNQQAAQRPRYHLSPEGRLMNLYWTHFEEYLQARRNCYAYAHSENESQRIKYKRAYLRALEKWRIWQDGLSDQEKFVIERRNYEHKPEDSYSVKHEIVYDRSQIDWTGPFVDQHFLKRQIEADYKGDVEETSGSMEDYQKIKDGYIPAKYRET